uniref:Uncharacterized protein n=1 Tax=Panagrolaimus sp. ES5 TaxID=591445 RepID=A0AC34GAT8_9BILA
MWYKYFLLILFISLSTSRHLDSWNGNGNKQTEPGKIDPDVIGNTNDGNDEYQIKQQSSSNISSNAEIIRIVRDVGGGGGGGSNDTDSESKDSFNSNHDMSFSDVYKTKEVGIAVIGASFLIAIIFASVFIFLLIFSGVGLCIAHCCKDGG